MATSPQPADPPLSLEPVVGWRAWRLRRGGGVLRLVSLTRDDRWAPNDAMEAKCPRHRAPTEGCTCGLYAASSPQDLAHSGVLGMDACVVGAIAMWGTVVEHSRGARSRYAYPARLRLVCGRCLQAGAGAVDPTGVFETGGALTAVCARHGRDLNGHSTPAAQVQSELLSTYGVDLMPIERIDRSLRTGPGPLRSNPPELLKVVALTVWSIVKMLVGGLFILWAYSGLILFALALVIGAFNAVTRTLGLAPADAAAPPVAVPSPVAAPVSFGPRTSAAPIVRDFPDRGVSDGPVTFPSIAFLCGVGTGARVDLVPCSHRPRALFGIAIRETPHGPVADCVKGWDAYAHGRRFWICWHRFGGAPDVERWVHSSNPWSIPVDEGGAIHEHR